MQLCNCISITQSIDKLLTENDPDATYSEEEANLSLKDETINNLIIMKTIIELSDSMKELYPFHVEDAFNQQMRNILTSMTNDDIVNLSFLAKELS